MNSGRTIAFRVFAVFPVLWLTATIPAAADILAGTYRTGGIFRLDDQTGDQVAPPITQGTVGLDSVAGLAVGPDGNIYASNQDQATGGGNILVFNGATGAPVGSGLFATMNDNPEHEASQPGPLRFNPNNTKIYVSDFTGESVRVFDFATKQELPFAMAGFSRVGGLTFSPDGQAYAGNFGFGSVLRTKPSGGQEPFILSGNGPIASPAGLLFLGNGDLLVASMVVNQIHRYSSTGQYLGVFYDVGLVGDEPDGTNYPSDLALDGDGNVLVAVLGATNPPDNRGKIVKLGLGAGVAGIPLGNVVENFLPVASVAWIPAVDAIPGDYNSNGSVGPEDYLKWKHDYGKWVAKGGGADGNGDGIVNAADYTVWRNRISGALGAGSAVPEPGSLLLGFLGAVATVSSHRRRRSRRSATN